SPRGHESTRTREDPMLKQTLLCTALITAGMIGTVSAQQSSQRPPIDHMLVFTEADGGPGAVNPAVLTTIIKWLAGNFDLPSANQPRVELVPPARIAAFRYRASLSRKPRKVTSRQCTKPGVRPSMTTQRARSTCRKDGEERRRPRSPSWSTRW